MNNEEGCSATCCPKLPVILVGKCRDPDTPQEHQDSLACAPPHRGYKSTRGCVGLWARGAFSRTAWQIELSSLIKCSLRYDKPTVTALWVPTGWVMVKGLGNHQVTLVRMHLGGASGEVTGAAPNPSGLGLGAGKTPP